MHILAARVNPNPFLRRAKLHAALRHDDRHTVDLHSTCVRGGGAWVACQLCKLQPLDTWQFCAWVQRSTLDAMLTSVAEVRLEFEFWQMPCNTGVRSFGETYEASILNSLPTAPCPPRELGSGSPKAACLLANCTEA